jgi:hypothetical protein
MLFLTDTCFWTHAIELLLEKIIDIPNLLSNFRWGITDEVRKEMMNFKLDQNIPLSQAYMIPITPKEWAQFNQRYSIYSHYDLADQSLFLCAIRDRSTILTDDGGIVMELEAIGQSAFFLSTFLLGLTANHQIEKKTMYRCLRYWGEIESYSKKQLNRWQEWLSVI